MSASRRLQLSALALAALLTSACSTARADVAQARTPSTKAAKRKGKGGFFGRGPFRLSGRAKAERAQRAHAPQKGGVMMADEARGRHRLPLPVQVAPAAIDLNQVPLFALPKSFAAHETPSRLPTTGRPAPIRIKELKRRRQPSKNTRSVYVVLEGEPLGRLQITSYPKPFGGGSDRVYRHCGETHFPRAMVLPMRWDSFKTDARGVPRYTVSDGWFDARSCNGREVRQASVTPARLLGGLAYAFRTPCKKCPTGEKLMLILPPHSQITTEVFGGTASVSHGGFALVQLPLQRGGAVTLSGMARSGNLARWRQAMRGSTNTPVKFNHVLFGLEIAHAVDEKAPTAIGYATYVKNAPRRTSRTHFGHRQNFGFR